MPSLPAVREAGPAGAPTVVLLHGLGTSGWMWDRVVPALERDLHVLVVDLPGHGDSRTTPWESLEATAAAVARLVGDRASGGAAHLAGLSLGGYVAAALAARRSDLGDRESVVEGKRGDLGGRRIIKKKKISQYSCTRYTHNPLSL